MYSESQILHYGLTCLPYLLMLGWLIYATYLSVRTKKRLEIKKSNYYKILPFPFLYVGIVGAFWGFMLSFINFYPETQLEINSIAHQVVEMRNSLILVLIGVGLFLMFKLVILRFPKK